MGRLLLIEWFLLIEGVLVVVEWPLAELVTDGYCPLSNFDFIAMLEDVNEDTMLTKEAIRTPLRQLTIDKDVKDIISDVKMGCRNADDGRVGERKHEVITRSCDMWEGSSLIVWLNHRSLQRAFFMPAEDLNMLTTRYSCC